MAVAMKKIVAVHKSRQNYIYSARFVNNLWKNIGASYEINCVCKRKAKVCETYCNHGSNYRLMSDNANKQQPGLLTGLKIRILDQYMRYLARFETIFEKRLPKVFRMYKHFKIGFSEFFIDSRTYYSVCMSLWGGKPLSSFSRKDLETYRQVPEDMKKLAPILIISIVPFTQYALLPLAYYFPSHLLSRQFWTAEQKKEFRMAAHKKSLLHYPPLLDGLQKCGKHLRDENRLILHNIRESHNVTPEEVLGLRQIFSTDHFQVENMLLPHQRHIARSLKLHLVSLRRGGLVLHYIDRHILREGVANMTDDDIQRACLWRGLNPTDSSRQDQEHFLTQWLDVSSNLNEKSISLLMHCHLFLSYNSPSNQLLLESTGKSTTNSP